MQASLNRFSLIELLIVIGLLGALAMLVLPNLHVERDYALDEAIAPAEMMDIRKAFAAFEVDCCPTASDKKKIGWYGLEVLMKYRTDRGWDFDEGYSIERGKGWRGPYLQIESTRYVYCADNSTGQIYADEDHRSDSGVEEIPVITDPRDNSGNNSANAYYQNYYRVIYHEDSGNLALVYVNAEDGSSSGDLLDTNTSTKSPDDTGSDDYVFQDYFDNNGDDIIQPLTIN